MRRRSSGVEHFHGKEGVSGSNPDDGSTTALLYGVFLFRRAFCLCLLTGSRLYLFE